MKMPNDPPPDVTPTVLSWIQDAPTLQQQLENTRAFINSLEMQLVWAIQHRQHLQRLLLEQQPPGIVFKLLSEEEKLAFKRAEELRATQRAKRVDPNWGT